MSEKPGRPVPPHGSGPTMLTSKTRAIELRRDPDETAGRALYRAIADRQARQDLAMHRRAVRIQEDEK